MFNACNALTPTDSNNNLRISSPDKSQTITCNASPVFVRTTISNTQQQPLSLKNQDFTPPARSPVIFNPRQQKTPELPGPLRQEKRAKIDPLYIAEELSNALQRQHEHAPQTIIKTIMEKYPELPVTERGKIGARLWLGKKTDLLAKNIATSLGVSKALFYREISVVSAQLPEQQAWIDNYMAHIHPGMTCAELDYHEKVQLAMHYFNYTTPSLSQPLWKLSDLLGISGCSLRRKIKKRLTTQPSHSAPAPSAPPAPADAISTDRPLNNEKEKYLQETLNRQLAQDYPGKSMPELSPDQRQLLALSYWQEQTLKPSLPRLAELTLTSRHDLVRKTHQLRTVPAALQRWVDEQLSLMPTDMQARYCDDSTLRMELAMALLQRIPSEFGARKWQLARVMKVSTSALLAKYRRLHWVPEIVANRVEEALTQRSGELQPIPLTDEEKAQTGAALWFNELSARVPEKTLAQLLNVDYLLLHQDVTILRAQQRESVMKAKRKTPTPPAPPDTERSITPEPVTIDSRGRPRKNLQNRVKKILNRLGIKAVRALPVSRKKTMLKKSDEMSPKALIKLEPVAVEPDKEVELMICGDDGEVVNTFATKQRPLTESYAIRNDLPILRDPLNPQNSVTLQAEGVETVQQLQVSYWGDLNTLPFRRDKKAIVQHARDLVSMEGPALAAWMEGLMVCHGSYVEDETGALVALGKGVFNNSGKVVPRGTVLGPVAGSLHQQETMSSLIRKEGSKNSLSHTWNTSSKTDFIDCFHERNLPAMFNSGKLPGNPTVAKNNVAIFILGKNIICYFTIKDVGIGEEYYVDYGKRYEPEIIINRQRREERIENSIQRVLYPHDVKSEPEVTAHLSQPARQPFPYTEQLISNIYHPAGWRENSSETLPVLISRTRAFREREAVLVIVDQNNRFTVAWDSRNHETLTPQNLAGRKLAVIQHVNHANHGRANHYDAYIPRAGRENVQFIRLHNSPDYYLEYSSCHGINIPAKGFCMTHAAWVALTGEINDHTQGELLRQQIVDEIQFGEHEELIKFNAQSAETMAS